MIARLSPFKTLGLGVILLPLLILPWWNLWAGLGFSQPDRQAILHDWGNWILILSSLAILLVFFSLAGAVLFWQSRAVWIDDGKLTFIHCWLPKTVELGAVDHFSIESIETGRFLTGLQGIGVHVKTGEYFQIPTYLLTEQRVTVLARLNESLAAKR